MPVKRALRWGGVGLLVPTLLCFVTLAGPQVCSSTFVLPAPLGTLSSAAVQCRQPGYSAEWFVRPGSFSMPQEVLVTPSGQILVQCVRSQALFRVTEDGQVTPFCSHVAGYNGTIDSAGNVYLYSQPDGTITRVSPAGQATVVVQSRKLQGNCDCAFAIGPDGDTYLALNQCNMSANLLRIGQDGRIAVVKTGLPALRALRYMSGDRFLAAGTMQVYELSLKDYSLRDIGPAPGDVSPGGLAVDDVGNVYISTGSRDTRGDLYLMDKQGHCTHIASIPDNGLCGIEWLSKTGEIIGGQLRQGGLIAVSPNGSIRTIVPGSGILTPQGIAFSPCGELAVSCDDGGMMALVDPAGNPAWFFDYLSFGRSRVAFAPDGTLFTTEAAAGYETQMRVAVFRPGGYLSTFARVNWSSGLARRPDGTLIVSEMSTGKILEFAPSGAKTVLAEGLLHPKGVALASDGTVYAITGASEDGGDTIVSVTPAGQVATVAHVDWTMALAISSTGTLFATTDDGVSTISPTGEVRPFLAGLRMPTGLAFDLAGNLYVGDEILSAIVRVGGFAQGTLSGIVVDEAGTPVPGARVQALSEQPIVVGQVQETSSDGAFLFRVSPCSCRVIVTAAGYKETRVDNVAVAAGDTAHLTISLSRP
jgi:hypothetical protein